MSKSQEIYVRRASEEIKKHVKLLAQRTWNSVILEYFQKDKAIKEVVSEIDIITTSST